MTLKRMLDTYMTHFQEFNPQFAKESDFKILNKSFYLFLIIITSLDWIMVDVFV